MIVRKVLARTSRPSGLAPRSMRPSALAPVHRIGDVLDQHAPYLQRCLRHAATAARPAGRYPADLPPDRWPEEEVLSVHCAGAGDRKSTRLNSSHLVISY